MARIVTPYVLAMGILVKRVGGVVLHIIGDQRGRNRRSVRGVPPPPPPNCEARVADEVEIGRYHREGSASTEEGDRCARIIIQERDAQGKIGRAHV